VGVIVPNLLDLLFVQEFHLNKKQVNNWQETGKESLNFSSSKDKILKKKKNY
jgi:hypothetical protein